MEPIGKYLKARNAGYQAYIDGIAMENNPMLLVSDKSMSSWWDTGWLAAKNEIVSIFERRSMKDKG